MPSFIKESKSAFRLYYDGGQTFKWPVARRMGVPSPASSPYYVTCSITYSGGRSSIARPPRRASRRRGMILEPQHAAAACSDASVRADMPETAMQIAEPLPAHEDLYALRREGDEAFLSKQLSVAEEKYARAGKLFADLGDNTEAATCWGLTGYTRVSLNKPFEAIVACEQGVQLDRTHWKCAFYGAIACEAVGLLNIAEERLAICSKLAPSSFTQVHEALARVQSKQKLLEDGDSSALMQEIHRFRLYLTEEETGYWISAVGELSRTPEGREELVEKGFLQKEFKNIANPADVARRGSYIALKYRVNKKVQWCLSAAGLTHGVGERCVLPKTLRDPSSVELLTEAACGTLAQDRLVIIDGAFSEPAMKQMKAELQALRRVDALRNDPNDVCNPDQVARYMPFADGPGKKEFDASCPVTMQVVKRIIGLPLVLEENLGLRLAAPQNVMLACYPPGASYKMHLDSYSLQGGYDEVPRKVTILLYCNVGWTPGVGGSLRTWAPFDEGRGPARDIDPVSGRIVAFMSEEIWHAVTEAHEERYALTFWVHDRDKVEILP